MKIRTIHWIVAASLAGGLAWAATASRAQEGQEQGTTPASLVVSVEAKHGREIPPITIEDVKVFQGSTPDRVTEFTPLTGKDGGLQLYVLMDDSSDATLSLQFKDVRDFIAAQPAGTQIAVGYLQNGTVKTAQEFTTDREAAGHALRLPLGAAFGGPSPYLSVSDLMKHWPTYNGRREILLLSEGVDELQEGPVDSYLDTAIEDAQKAGVQAYAIYTSASGHLGHTYWRIYWGQYDLSRLADETGGELYWQGMETPVSFHPYLQEFANRLEHQYRLTFLARGKKGSLQHVSLETSAKGVQIVGAHDVYVPESR